METFSTKEDVTRRLGLPTEKREGDNIDEWIYDFGSTTTGSTTSIPLYPYYGNRYSVTNMNSYQRYVKFTFNKRGYVTHWQTQGVNWEKKEPAPGKTIAAILISIAAAVGVGVAAASSSY